MLMTDIQKIILIPGTRHTPLGNGIWAFVMRTIFPQGWIVVAVVVAKNKNETKNL